MLLIYVLLLCVHYVLLADWFGDIYYTHDIVGEKGQKWVQSSSGSGDTRPPEYDAAPDLEQSASSSIWCMGMKQRVAL
jgi:hypothetical protein